MTGGRHVSRIALAALLAATLAAGAVAVTSAASSPPRPTTRPAARASARPNIVFILTDDLSWNLISRRLTPHIFALERQGGTFSHYFVADSLCCPSRSSIFTGLLPHDSKVFTNFGPDGGYHRFQAEGLYRRTYAVAVRARGYRTAMMGKYLNGYGTPTMTATTAPIAPGWSDWHVAGNGYLEFDYTLNDNGRFNFYGGPTGRCRV